MTALLKTTQIQEPSSATVNLALDTSGGVTVGGATTFTGGIASAGVPIKGSSSGTTTLVAASTASGTVTIPAGTGTAAVQGISTNIVSATAQASTSGTSIDFTSIPSWVKRITVMFSGVSTNGTSNLIVQLGTGATPTYTTSGYLGSASDTTGATQTNFSSGFLFNNSVNATQTYSGLMTIVNLTGNTWSESSMLGDSAGAALRYGAGSVPLAATLTALRITTAGGANTFDAGTINIMYE